MSEKKPRCPQCNRKNKIVPSGDREYWCPHCRMYFDDDPDEGGDFSSRDPSARLEREERRGKGRNRKR